jgi:D-alanyl-lipoteichoic acid acyltransferase DltB (MBOAT superfamily)
MLFNSPVFLFVFLPICLMGFAVLGRWQTRAALIWLASASLCFYGWWNPIFLGLIVPSMAFNWTVGRWLAHSATEGSTLARRSAFLLAVLVNLGLLGYFKYFGFFVESVNQVAGTAFTVRDMVLPLGISFFTFEQITYIRGAYSGRARATDPVRYALFVTFFPHLIAGPIVLYTEMMPQFERPSTFRLKGANLAVGASIFAIGLCKKVVIADSVAGYAGPAFAAAGAGAPLTFFEAWGAALAYTFQLYFDFSGYSDMAIGLGRLFGVRLPLNFDSPYKAANIIEFWRRWHMTLSRFLRDYLYVPLGGNRHGTTRRYVNLMITMLLGGLWHGAGWTFVIWGGLHGAYLVVNHLWRAATAPLTSLRRVPRWASSAAARLVTFTAVVVAWVFFRAENLDAALVMLRGMTGANGFLLPKSYLGVLGPLGGALADLGWRFESAAGHFQGGAEIAWLGTLLLLVWSAPNTQEIMRAYRPALGFSAGPIQGIGHHVRWRPNLRSAIVVAVIAAVSILSLNRVTEFLYFQF